MIQFAKIRICLAIVLGLFLAAGTARGDDASANEAFAEALKLQESREYLEAAERFADAEIEAASPDLKLKAALREAENYRLAGHRGKEFEAIEKIIAKYPTATEFGKLVDRQYAIGDAYFEGYRDPAFWSLRFIPWLTDKNRMPEVYETALKHAPFSPASATARLRLAIYCLEERQNEKALKLLREIVQYFPQTKAARYALLELGNALCQMAERGDGDNAQFNEAMKVFADFRKKNPTASELEWVNQCEAKAREACAKRLLTIAEFYHSEGRTQPAVVYLLDVMRRFPDTESAIESEKMLTKLDKSYFPEAIEPAVTPLYPEYDKLAFPEDPRKLLVTPQSSGNRFLLPIYDLNLPRNNQKKTGAQDKEAQK